jgi:uncharacterized membrane protein YeiH
MYYVELLGTAVFAITGVLAVRRRGLDVIGAVVFGLVTALGGGTVRDLLIRFPIFWFEDFNYVWAAVLAAVAAFWLAPLFHSTFRGLLYLDALGAALFTVSAAEKVIVNPLPGGSAVMMGVLTGIGGGLIRDVLAGRPTLLVSRDIYATPILIGCTLFVLLRRNVPEFTGAWFAGAATIFILRALAIHFHLQMPGWMTDRESPEVPAK